MLSDPEYQELAAFRYQIRAFLNFSEEAALEAGIEPRQHQALLTIKAASSSEPCSIGLIAKQLFLHHQSAVGLVNRLETRKLVVRTGAPFDARQVIVQLTPKGRQVLQSLTLVHRAELEQRGPELARALRAIMRRWKGTK